MTNINDNECNDNDDLGIYAMPSFGRAENASGGWDRIGTAVQNDNGALTLTFDCWPTNVQAMQLCPLGVRPGS